MKFGFVPSFKNTKNTMAMAGRLVLLTLFLLLGSGALTQTNAQEKLVSQTLRNVSKNNTCSYLSSYLVTQSSTCEYLLLSQKDNALKTIEKEKEETPTGITYAIEPIYYIEPTITPSPTDIPVTQATPAVTQLPVDMVPAQGSSLNSDLILELINAHRASIGKPAFQKEGALCSLAQTRSVELQGELFGNAGYLHSGLYNRNLPYWITENAKWGSNEAGTVQWWLNSPVHRRAIDGDYTYSCGACDGSKCAQLFTSYTPKGGLAATPTTSTPLAIGQ